MLPDYNSIHTGELVCVFYNTFSLPDKDVLYMAHMVIDTVVVFWTIITTVLYTIIIGDPIDTSCYSENDRDALVDKVRSIISGNLERVKKPA